MSIIPRLLDLLERDALVVLQDLRGLPGKATNHDRKVGLARSYRGDIESFLSELRREDLLVLLSRDFVIAGRRYSPTGLSACNREQLEDFAVSLFFDVTVPLSFVETTHTDAFVIEDPEDEGDDEERNGEPDETGTDPQAEEPTQDGLAGPEWGNARSMGPLLKAVGMEVPIRLRTVRFQEFMRKLTALGIEVQLLDGTPLQATDDSPGIAQKIRIRRRAAQTPQSLDVSHPTPFEDLETTAPSFIPPQSQSEHADAFVVEIGARPSVSTASNARVRCSLEPGPAGFVIDADADGVTAVCRESHSTVLRQLGPAERLRLASGTLRVQVEGLPAVTDEVEPSFAVALALLAVARGVALRDNVVAIGSLRDDGSPLTTWESVKDAACALRSGAKRVLVGVVERAAGARGDEQTTSGQIFEVKTLDEAFSASVK